VAPVIVWITEGTWQSSVDAARELPGQVVLLHVTPAEVADLGHGAFAGLLGRGHPERDPGARMERLAAQSAADLLGAAERRLGRACTRAERSGRVEREVVAVAEGAGLLVVARDGDRLGPRSLGPATRFVVDHAPCPVLLVWPRQPQGKIPPPPPRHHPHPPPG
jgi:nucleotide-binding universal stress UspA family protein